MALTDEEKKERKRISGVKYQAANRKAISERAHLWVENNRERNRKNTNTWRFTNKDKVNGKRKKRRAGNPKKTIEQRRIYKKRSADELTDGYIRGTLTNDNSLSFKDIPIGLVELKRQQLILTRTIKEIKKCKT